LYVGTDKADSKEGSEWTNPDMGYCAMGGKISIEESMNHYEIRNMKCGVLCAFRVM
jgi:hypothetical protein